MRKLVWTLLLAVSALVVTFAAGSALQVVAEANASKAAEPYVVVVNDDTTWRRSTPPREVGLRERIVSAVRAFRDDRD
jgi:hypothetical protein